MNILHTIPGLNWGGMEFRVLEQVAWLNANGHRAWLATPDGGESFKRAKNMGLPVIDFDFSRPWRWRTVGRLRKLLKDLKIELADVHVTRDAKAMMACLDLVGVVRSRHITQRLKPGLVRSLQWRLGADQVIAVAACIAKAMTADGLVERDRIHVVGEWADDAFFTPVPEDVRQGLRRELSLLEGQVVLACIGMLRPEKGQDTLLAALRELPENFVALMVGEATAESGDYARQLRDRSLEWGLEPRLRWLGYRKDIPELLAASDLVAVPSTLEAQSRVVPQAFAAGKPVVATRVGGLPELVQDGGTGLLTPPGDPYALADALRRLAEDGPLAASCRVKGRKLAEGALRMGSRMEATLDVYAKALERAGRRGYFRRKAS